MWWNLVLVRVLGLFNILGGIVILLMLCSSLVRLVLCILLLESFNWWFSDIISVYIVMECRNV